MDLARVAADIVLELRVEEPSPSLAQAIGKPIVIQLRITEPSRQLLTVVQEVVSALGAKARGR